MHSTAIEMYKAIKQMHQDLYVVLKELRESVIPGLRDSREYVDMIYAMRECIKLIEDTRKDMSGAQELATRIGCAIWATTSDGSNIRTEYCIGMPDIKMLASVPNKNKDPEKFAALMDHMGIPRNLWDVPDSEQPAIKPHFLGMVDYVSRMVSDGKPLPDGISIDKTYPKYVITVRGRKGVDE